MALTRMAPGPKFPWSHEKGAERERAREREREGGRERRENRNDAERD